MGRLRNRSRQKREKKETSESSRNGASAGSSWMEAWLGLGPPDGTPEPWTRHWFIIGMSLSLPPYSSWKGTLPPRVSL